MWISTSLKYNTVQALWPRALASSYLMLVVSVYWTAISWEFEPCSRAPWKRERDLGNKTKNFQYWLYVICHLESFGSYCRLRIYLMQSYKTFQAFPTKFTERMRSSVQPIRVLWPSCTSITGHVTTFICQKLLCYKFLRNRKGSERNKISTVHQVNTNSSCLSRLLIVCHERHLTHDSLSQRTIQCGTIISGPHVNTRNFYFTKQHFLCPLSS